MIYFMGAESGKPIAINHRIVIGPDSIKIGCSVDPQNRLMTLKSHYQRKDLVILGVMPGGLTTEEALHERFDHCRIRFRLKTRGAENGSNCPTEWFSPDDEMRAYIRDHAHPVEDIENLPSELRIEADDRFVMMIEYAARHAGKTPDEFVRETLLAKLKQRNGSAYPFVHL